MDASQISLGAFDAYADDRRIRFPGTTSSRAQSLPGLPEYVYRCYI